MQAKLRVTLVVKTPIIHIMNALKMTLEVSLLLPSRAWWSILLGWVERTPLLLLLQVRGRGDDGNHVSLSAPTLMRRHHRRAIKRDWRLVEAGAPTFPRLQGACLGVDDLLNVPALPCYRYEDRRTLVLGGVGLSPLDDGNSLRHISSCQNAHNIFRQ